MFDDNPLEAKMTRTEVAAMIAYILMVGGMLLLLYLWPVPAQAQDGYDSYHWDWGLGSGDPHKRYHRSYRLPVPARRYYRATEAVEEGRRYEIIVRHDRDHSGWECIDKPVYVLSTEHTEVGLAMESAKKLWSATSQWNYGSRFMNLENAADERIKCDQSNAMDTISGRLVEGAQKLIGNDGQNVRCVIAARPCSAPLEDAEEKRR